MTKLELLRLLRTLSAVESAMLCKVDKWPDHLIDDLEHFIGIIEREILNEPTRTPN